MTQNRNWFEVDFKPEMNKAINNLSLLGGKCVPAAARSSTNKMARLIRKQTIQKAATQLRIPSTVLRYHDHRAGPGKKKPRFVLLAAKRNKTQAVIRMGRTAIPSVRLIKSPELQDTRIKKIRKRGYIKAGKHVYGNGAFVASGVTKHAKGVLKGRYQIMRRTGKKRYPLQVLKIETKTAITRHAIRETRTELRSNSGKYLKDALFQQTKKNLLK